MNKRTTFLNIQELPQIYTVCDSSEKLSGVLGSMCRKCKDCATKASDLCGSQINYFCGKQIECHS